jgi:hypothetical protein
MPDRIDPVIINGHKYTLSDHILRRYVNPLAGKINTGADSLEADQYLSHWSTKDAGAGIGVEEMDESVDAGKCWWTNCLVDYSGHILLPRKVNTVTPIAIPNAWVLPTGFTASGWADEAQAYDGNTANYASITVGAGWTEYLELTCPVKLYDAVSYYVTLENATADIEIDVYYSSAYHNIYTGVATTGAYTTVAIGSNEYVSKVRFRKNNTTGTDFWNRVHEIRLQQATVALSGTLGDAVNFNGNLYWAYGRQLLKLDSGRTTITGIYYFPATITALIPSLNSRLYIFLGDSSNYWYMSTTEVFTVSNSANAYHGIEHGGYLYKLNTSGAWARSSDPDDAAPTWTSKAAITNDVADIQGLILAPDADGINRVYCPTKAPLKVYDDTNNLWLDTNCRLPYHPLGGKGASYWNDAIYLSYGLGVKRYSIGSTASLSDVGLDLRDGLPVEYNGEIVKLYGDAGMDVMFAAIDASQVTGTAKSGIYAFTGLGWRCWYIDSANDSAMGEMIVSNAQSGYALYFAVGTSIKYIDIVRGIRNPTKITLNYELAGAYYSPWYDAGSPPAVKLAKRLKTFAKGITTTETVVIKYRTNKTYTDLATGWTTFDTLNVTGDNNLVSNELASGAGLSFNSIQYALILASGSATLSPDIQGLDIPFRLMTNGNWIYSIPIVIDGKHDLSTKDQRKALEAAVESATDIPIVYGPDAAADVFYAKLELPNSWTLTGLKDDGKYVLQAIRT